MKTCGVLFILLRLIEEVFYVYPNIIIVSITSFLMGVFTFLYIPLVMSFLAEHTYPIKTNIAIVLTFMLTAISAVVLSTLKDYIELIPLALGGVMVFCINEDEGLSESFSALSDISAINTTPLLGHK